MVIVLTTIVGLTALAYIFYNEIVLKKLKNTPNNLLDRTKVLQMWLQSLVIYDLCLPIVFKVIDIMHQLGVSEVEPMVLKVQLRRKLALILGNKKIEAGTKIKKVQVEGIDCFVMSPSTTETENEATDKLKTMFFYHGGSPIGLAEGSHLQMCQVIAKKCNVTVVSVECRLAPEFPFPQGLLDCYNATVAYIKINKIEDYILAGDSLGGCLTLTVGMKMAELNLEHPNYIPKPLLLAPIYPTVQAINFNTKSYKDKSLPSLERNAVINCTLGYALPEEKICSQLIENIANRDHLKWLTKEEKVRIFPMIGIEDDDEIYNEHKEPTNAEKKLKDILLNKNFSPLIASDLDLENLLNFVKNAIYITYMEHDVLTTDSELLTDRLKSIESNLIKRSSSNITKLMSFFESATKSKVCKVSSNMVEGGYHALFNISCGKSGFSEADKVVDKWCGEIMQYL